MINLKKLPIFNPDKKCKSCGSTDVEYVPTLFDYVYILCINCSELQGYLTKESPDEQK